MRTTGQIIIVGLLAAGCAKTPAAKPVSFPSAAGKLTEKAINGVFDHTDKASNAISGPDGALPHVDKALDILK